MTNIIYNYFLQKYFSHDVDLTKGSYKLALFKETYTPSINGTFTYDSLSLAGFECEDSNPLVADNPKEGYKKGGKAVIFHEIEDTPPNDIYKKYRCDDVEFKNVTLTGDNTPAYALIYRDTTAEGSDSQKLLVCCFQLQIPEVNKEDLILSWANTITIQISADMGLTIDTVIDGSSTNPVQNRAIAEALERYASSIEKYGIRFNNEGDDDNPDTDDSNVDSLSRVNENTIDQMFNED